MKSLALRPNSIPGSTPEKITFSQSRMQARCCLLLADSVEEVGWRIGMDRAVVLGARLIVGLTNSQAGLGFGIGTSFASLRRFWAVAARRNSSRAPFGPRKRSRSSLRMRLR